MRDTFVSQVTAMMEIDPDVYFITGDLGFGIFDHFPAKFGHRFINAGVAEQNMMAIATGLGLLGRKVICYSIANFTFMRCLEQLRNGPIYHNLNVTVVSSGGGFTYGQLGFSHFAIEDYGVLSSFPNLEIYHPSTSKQVADCLRASIESQSPSYLRLEKVEVESASDAVGLDPLGLSCHCKGGRTAVLGVGGVFDEVLHATGELSDVGVYSMPRHAALWSDELKSELSTYDVVLVVEEHVERNSVAIKLGSVLSHTEVIGMNIHDAGPSIVGDQNFLRTLYALDATSIKKRLENLI